ncbi:MAG: polysaccharide pyruvyl transferase family protein [Thiobacillus sp.]|nr:polysaccharide pyruvyl transferase family protein [Thiobacillus sp.]
MVTHHWVPNFGANLQAYATVQALSDRGHDVALVNFRPLALEQRYQGRVSQEQRGAHEDFVRRYFQQTDLVRDQSDFGRLVETGDFDLLVSGSDAVFRLQPQSQRADFVFPNPYWLYLPSPGVRKATLSVSSMGCQFAKLSASERAGVKTALENLDYVAVRDDWTIEQLRLCGYAGEIVKSPDPVFYLRAMIEDISQKADRTSPYIAVSAGGWFGVRWMREFKRIANSEGYRVVGLPTPEASYDDPVDERIATPLGPFDWMRWIAESSGYLGARYHPVVVALLAMVPVLSTDKYHFSWWDKRRSKNYDLMAEFGISQYCIGKLRKKYISPSTAFQLMREQEGGLDLRRRLAEQWTGDFEAILGAILAA